MINSQLFRQVSRSSLSYTRPTTSPIASRLIQSSHAARFLSTTPRRFDVPEDPKDDPYRHVSTAAEPHETADNEGRFARTDRGVRVEYPEESDLPRSQIVQGRGAFELRRTLDSFSLEGRTAVVTGGARGLGLVMGQALVQSGADLAIVDLNSKPHIPPFPQSTPLRPITNAYRQSQRTKQHTKPMN